MKTKFTQAVRHVKSTGIFAFLLLTTHMVTGQTAPSGMQYRLVKVAALKYAVLLDLPANSGYTDVHWSNCNIVVLHTDGTTLSHTNRQGSWVKGTTFNHSVVTGVCSQNSTPKYDLTSWTLPVIPGIDLDNCTSGSTDTLFFITASSAVSGGEIRLHDGSNGTTIVNLDDCLGEPGPSGGPDAHHAGTIDPDGVAGSGGSTGYDLPGTGTEALPVRLVEFDAAWEGDNGLVFWSTASETNCSHFDIERSIDGEDYEPIGRVNTKSMYGNSSNLIDYMFVDRDIKKGIQQHVRYKLIQYDLDGQFEKFGTVTLEKSDRHSAFTGQDVVLYPVPSNNLLNITLLNSEDVDESDVRIELYTSTGSKLEPVNVLQTLREETDKSIRCELDVSQLISGVYFAKITSEGIITTRRFEVLH
ncbi:MAG: T9SS type A sorting domain-containing protein [Bacteroidia bacterium]|nr:T9SS type A sorting domain-containing protein [Bacteroidia bacterium]